MRIIDIKNCEYYKNMYQDKSNKISVCFSQTFLTKTYMNLVRHLWWVVTGELWLHGTWVYLGLIESKEWFASLFLISLETPSPSLLTLFGNLLEMTSMSVNFRLSFPANLQSLFRVENDLSRHKLDCCLYKCRNREEQREHLQGMITWQWWRNSCW